MATVHHFTEGKILQPLIRFALPVLAALFLQAVYGAVDLLVVGHFSDAAQVSAVSTGSQLLMTVTNLVAAMSMGCTVVLGQQIGKREETKAGETVGATMALFTAGGILLALFMAVLAPQLSAWLQAPPEALEATSSYIRICGAGMLVVVAYNLISCVFRGMGDSMTPLFAVMVACVGNVFGDLALVAGFHMGAAGAALATVIAQALSVILSLVVIRKKTLPFSFSVRKNFRWHKSLIRRIVGIGVPIAIQDFMVSVSFLIVMAIVNTLGVVASAGVGVAEKVCGFIMLCPSAFMQSLAAFVAQNYGAGKMERATQALRYAIMIAASLGCFMSFGAWFHGDTLSGLFSQDTQIIEASWDYLQAYAIDCILTPVFFCFIGFYNGMGQTRFVMLQGILSAFLVRVPVSYAMSLWQPVSLFHIGLATPLSSLLQIVLALWFYRYLRRKRHQGFLKTA